MAPGVFPQMLTKVGPGPGLGKMGSIYFLDKHLRSISYVPDPVLSRVNAVPGFSTILSSTEEIFSDLPVGAEHIILAACPQFRSQHGTPTANSVGQGVAKEALFP